MDEIRRARAHIEVSTRKTSKRLAARRRNGELTKVFRNVLVETAYLVGARDKWEAARRVTAARICAVSIALGPRAVVIGQAAAFAQGIEACAELMDVHVNLRTGVDRPRDVLPEIMIPGGPAGGVVPSSLLVRHQFAVDDDWVVRSADGVRHTDLATTALMCARMLPTKEGTVAVSGTLRAMSSFTRFRGEVEAGRRREEEARTLVLDRLSRMPTRRGRVRARAVIAAADAACESVPERVLLWILKAAGFGEVATQVHHRVDGRDYYVDIELPRWGVGVESDSRVKHEMTSQDVSGVHESYERQARRQKALESMGLTFARFTPGEYADPARVVEEVARRCGIRAPAPVMVLAA